MTETTAAPPAWKSERKTRPRAWWALALILMVSAMDILDGTIVNVAIPSIREDLGTSSAGLQWIVGGYALTFAIGLIAGGRLGDIYGRRRMFQIGVASFTLMSLLCGLAPSSAVLITTRLLQGFAAAMMIPQGFGLIRESFSQKDLPRALSFWGPSSALGALLGPVIGGLLIDLDAFGSGWRAVFLVNIPLGIFAVIASTRLLPEASEHGDKSGLDVTGAAILGLAVGLLFFPLIEGREQGWPLWIFAMFPASAAMLYFFVRFERHREHEGKSRIILLSVFNRISFVGGSSLVSLLFVAMAGLLLVTTLYLQIDQNYSAIHAGLTFVPLSIGTAIGAIGAGMFLLPRIGRHTLHLGAVTGLVGTLALLFVLDAYGANITTWHLAIPTMIFGMGVGLLITPAYSFAMSGLSFIQLGSGSGVINSMQQLGTAIGVAAIGTIFFSVAGDHGMLVALERAYVVIAGIMLVVGLLIFALPMVRDTEPASHT